MASNYSRNRMLYITVVTCLLEDFGRLYDGENFGEIDNYREISFHVHAWQMFTLSVLGKSRARARAASASVRPSVDVYKCAAILR